MKQYSIAHSLSWRTRIKARPLRHFSGDIKALEQAILSFSGVTCARINCLSASMIVEHQGPLPEHYKIFDFIEQLMQRPSLYSTPGITGLKSNGILSNTLRQKPRPHVSGKVLIVSGTYLFARWLWLGSLISAGPLVLMITTALGVRLSLPIIREELNSIKETGNPSLTTLTTSALYYTMLTGTPGGALSIFWLFNLSSWLETRTLVHTRNSIRNMLQGKIRNSWLIKDDTEILVPTSALVPGDVIRLVQGDIVPVDGVILMGKVLINQAPMTGESMPVLKFCGNRLLAGTIVEAGGADLTVVCAEKHTRLAAIIRFVENAENSNSGYRRFADELGQRLFPFSLTLFAVTLAFTGNMLKALSMLIITCPCAIRISTSTAVSAAIGTAAKQGIMIKGGEYIEQAGRINTLVFDKTGTLTSGVPKASKIISLDKTLTPDQLLQLASAAQSPFKHPVTSAVLDKIRCRGLEIPHAFDHRLSLGKGVSATVKGLRIEVGSESFMKDCGVDCREAVFLIKSMNNAGKTILFIAVNGRLSGMIGISDLLKSNAVQVLATLKTRGIDHIAMLTGDRREVAEKAAKELLIDQTLGELSPEQKAEWIIHRRRQFPRSVVAMVGDGINDTPAFAHADLSLAMGSSGADTAVEYADIVIQKDDLALVAETLYLGKKTRSIFRQNVTTTILLNTLLCIFTAAGFVSPVSGALMHNLITIGVVGNSARLLTAKSDTSKSPWDATGTTP